MQIHIVPNEKWQKIHIKFPTQNNKLKLPVIVVECKMHTCIVFSSTQHINLQLRVTVVKCRIQIYIVSSTQHMNLRLPVIDVK